MPWNLTMQRRRDDPCRFVDEALRQAFAPLLAEAVPDRFRAALNALRKKGSDDDPNDPNKDRSR